MRESDKKCHFYFSCKLRDEAVVNNFMNKVLHVFSSKKLWSCQ